MKIYIPVIAAVSLLLATACQDDISTQGSSLVGGEVSITIDSIPYNIPAVSVENPDFDAKATTKLLGRVNVPEYGKLDCSFMSQLLSATALAIPDSITEARIDSMRMVLSVPRGALTGDSLAPQQLQVFKLSKTPEVNVPSNINPDDYYSKSDLIGTKSYTLSNIAARDTAFKKAATINIPVMMKREMALKYFNMYRNTPEVFQWPATFAKEFPGVYVRQNFGNGCIAAINQLNFYLYWNKNESEYRTVDGEYKLVNVLKRDSVCIFSSQPEVVSTNVIDYQISDHIRNLVAQGESIITTPGGYYVDITFPAEDIIDTYNKNYNRMSVISKLSMSIPAEVVENDYNLGVAPYLLMVKKSEREEFFAKNKVPDGITSFYATYNSTSGCYTFAALRQYLLDLIDSGKALTPEDVEFSLVPVLIATENVENYSTTTTYVVKCSPYIGYPTMTRLHTDNSTIVFTFSRQQID